MDAGLSPDPTATPQHSPLPVFAARRKPNKNAHHLDTPAAWTFQHATANNVIPTDWRNPGQASARPALPVYWGRPDTSATPDAAGPPRIRPRVRSYEIEQSLHDSTEPLTSIDAALIEAECRTASAVKPHFGCPEVKAAADSVWFKHLLGVIPRTLQHTSCAFCGCAVFHILEHSRESPKCIFHRTDPDLNIIAGPGYLQLRNEVDTVVDTDIVMPTLSDVPPHRESESGVAEHDAERHLLDIAARHHAAQGIYDDPSATAELRLVPPIDYYIPPPLAAIFNSLNALVSTARVNCDTLLLSTPGANQDHPPLATLIAIEHTATTELCMATAKLIPPPTNPYHLAPVDGDRGGDSGSENSDRTGGGGNGSGGGGGGGGSGSRGGGHGGGGGGGGGGAGGGAIGGGGGGDSEGGGGGGGGAGGGGGGGGGCWC